jgi:hypothetical protein
MAKARSLGWNYAILTNPIQESQAGDSIPAKAEDPDVCHVRAEGKEYRP